MPVTSAAQSNILYSTRTLTPRTQLSRARATSASRAVIQIPGGPRYDSSQIRIRNVYLEISRNELGKRFICKRLDAHVPSYHFFTPYFLASISAGSHRRRRD